MYLQAARKTINRDVVQGTRFPTHKSVLLARCPYFKDLLLAAGSLATELIVRLATPGVDTVMFSSLLRFLYTGEYPSQVRSAGACRCATPPSACCWTRSPQPWTRSASCAGKGIKSVILSVIIIIIHFL